MSVEKAERSIKLFKDGLKAKEQGKLMRATKILSEAIDLCPNVASYHLNLAIVCTERAKERDELMSKAFHHAQMAVKIKPDDFGTWVIYAEIALNCNRFPEAIAAYEKALDMQPNHGFMWALLAYTYRRNGQPELMRVAAEKAIHIDPELGIPHFLLSSYFFEDHFNPERIAYHGEQGFLAPKTSVLKLECMWNAAHGFLTIGNYTKGWNYLEARLTPNMTNVGQVLPLERFPNKPLWRGERGKRVVVSHEMGLGDAIVMARYLPMIKSKFDCDVTFECMENMLELMQHNFPDIKCVPWDRVDHDSIDVQLPLLSLPLVFETKNDTVPWNGPYIHAIPERMKYWSEERNPKVRSEGVLNVAVCWNSGRNSHSADNHTTSKRKSLTFEQIKPVLEVPGINFISLQTTAMESFPNPGIRDFSDTAALIALADIVISVDTAVANLAGAMGKDLWLLDRFDHDWRYSDNPTPWYPTATVYRQPEPHEWDSVVAKIVGDLACRRDTMRHAA